MLIRFVKNFLSGSGHRSGTPLCLMFHRIGELDDQLAPLHPLDAVTEETFRSVIREVAENWCPLSISDLTERLRSGRTIPKRAVVITFDDGFADNLTVALPILEDFCVPATVYVTTGFIDRSIDPFQYDLASLVCASTEIEFGWAGQRRRWHLNSAVARTECYTEIYRHLKSSTATVRTAAMSGLMNGVRNLPDHRVRYLTWEQLQELAASPLITIGGHTHSHLVLDAVNRDEMAADIERGRQLLQSRLRVAVRHFSYPYGHHDRTVRRTVSNLGFQCAMETDRNRNRQPSDLFQIPRVNVTNETAFTILGPTEEACVGALRPTSSIKWESTDATDR